MLHIFVEVREYTIHLLKLLALFLAVSKFQTTYCLLANMEKLSTAFSRHVLQQISHLM